MASIRHLIEHAFKDWLDGQSLSATVFTGVSASTKSLPAVIVRLADATEEPIYSGNYNCTVEIRIESAAASGETAHESLCSTVRNLIWADDLKANLETAGALTVFGAASPHKVEYDTEEDAWIERHTVDLYCAARVFPA
jgi:hypothetical protein